jgi:hypothetical protein
MYSMLSYSIVLTSVVSFASGVDYDCSVGKFMAESANIVTLCASACARVHQVRARVRNVRFRLGADMACSVIKLSRPAILFAINRH